MKSLLKTDWDLVEKVIEEMLNDHMRTWGWYDYFVIDDSTIIVKVFDEDDMVRFVIRSKFNNGKLEVVEVS
ncbi:MULTISPECIES: hypothetical protein [unclassified Stygiolobus]|jgi:hypothetical protein|uniref:hypothetical protein n=1 Tax=unclassified Stygiolobus TaxID=2824672 RepID=UPI00307F73C7